MARSDRTERRGHAGPRLGPRRPLFGARPPGARIPSWPGAARSSTSRPKIRLQSLPSRFALSSSEAFTASGPPLSLPSLPRGPRPPPLRLTEESRYDGGERPALARNRGGGVRGVGGGLAGLGAGVLAVGPRRAWA